MSSLTPNYNFVLPAVNSPTDEDLWGDELNANWSAIDTDLKTVSDQANLASPATLAKTANYTILTTDKNKVILVDATSGDLVITLPTVASATSGFRVSVQKIDASANTVTVDGNGSETIDGAANYVLTERYDVVSVITNGTTWYTQVKVSSVPVFGLGASAYQSTGTSLPSDTDTAISFNQEEYDELDCHSTSVNPSRFTFDFDGRISVVASVNFGTSANGDYVITIKKNGTDVIGYNEWLFTSGAANAKLSLPDTYDVSNGDYIEVFAKQRSGGTATTGTGIYNTTMKLFRVK